MALYRLNFTRIFRNTHRSTVYLLNDLKHSAPSKSSAVDLQDVLDNFTTELLQKKKDEWYMRDEKLKSIKERMKHKHKHYRCNLDVKNLSKEKLNELLSSALVECNDMAVMALLKEFYNYELIPSQDLIVQVLNICAHYGEIDLILNLEKLYKLKDVSLPTNLHFEISKAHAIWMRGNIIKGLELFQEIYIMHPCLRRLISMTLKQLVSVGIKNNSEVVLIRCIEVAKHIIKHYKDYTFLISIWEYCFISEWYSDQQLALNILDENRKLAELMTNRLPFLLTKALQNHMKETVYKLLEYSYDMKLKEQCTIVAMALLDYHSLQMNIGSYSEVIRWCEESNIALPRIYNHKYLQLLLRINDLKKPIGKKTKQINKIQEFIF